MERLLYDYFRSSASYRVRIALNLKGLPYDLQEVHLVKDGGQQHAADYVALNPQGRVPALAEGGDVLKQSLAILEYLEEQYPEPALLPQDPVLRAKVRAAAHTIAMDIHPLNNLSVLHYLQQTLSVDDEQKQAWYAHWIQIGFRALEAQLQPTAGPYCFGKQPTFADVCLIPQMYNARRFNVDLRDCPTLQRIDDQCMQLDAFAQADPDNA